MNVKMMESRGLGMEKVRVMEKGKIKKDNKEDGVEI